MANSFSKEDRTLFEQALAKFNDQCVISKNVAKFGVEGELMERANDTINRPVPYIANSQTRTVGSAVTAFDATQLKVPATLSYKPNVTFSLDALELRDGLQDERLSKAAAQRLSSDLNNSVRDVASLEGTLVVPITGAAGDYDDVALAESMMLEQGLDGYERCLALTARDYNGLAGNLAVATRSFGNKKSDDAYEKSYVGMIAGFETLKIDGGKRLAAQAATPTVDTTGAIVQYAPTNTADNRYQQITISSTTGLAVGDAFTIAGIESVHHITKESTGQLKTFRVKSIDSGTLVTISPAIVGAGGATDAEIQYQNVNVASTSATAAITFLNANATACNPFWVKESIEILPGRYAVPQGQGVEVLRGTTDQGIELVMGKSFSNSTFKSLYTFDIFYGVVNCNPEMNGVILWGQ